MEEKQRLAMHVSICTIWINLLLSILKLVAGIVANSGAMISDAVHSASDVASTVVVMVGVKLAGKKSDKKHPYGHERLESVAAASLAALLSMTGLCIGWAGLKTILHSNSLPPVQPGMLALVAAALSIVVKEGMFWYTRSAAKKTGMDVLMADAWHHRSDAISSVGSLIGIAGARMGFALMDPLASIVICVFIVKVGIHIGKEAVEKLIDQSCSEEVGEKMERLVAAQPGVCALEEMKTRMFGSRIYVDIIISADGKLTLYEAHEIAQLVHDEVEQEFPAVKHCMVHVNPEGITDT